MSKKQAEKFTKQLKAFVHHNTPPTAHPWIGTITTYSDNLQYCNVKTERGELAEVPAFGVPSKGTSAIILFLDGSYNNPVAICNPINVLDENKINLLKVRGAANYHNNGDFTREPTGYKGTHKIDDSILTGNIPVIVTYQYNGQEYSLETNSRRIETYPFGNMTVTISEKTDWGSIPIKVEAPLPDGESVTIDIFGTKYLAHFGNEEAIFHYYPDQGYTANGDFLVLPHEEDYVQFDVKLEEGEKDFFKVQMYYKSMGSKLGMEVKDKYSNELLESKPASIGTTNPEWKIMSNDWMVNREIFDRGEHEDITVKLTNKGDNPIKIDGILVYDENSDYNFYKSKEDLLNGK